LATEFTGLGARVERLDDDAELGRLGLQSILLEWAGATGGAAETHLSFIQADEDVSVGDQAVELAWLSIFVSGIVHIMRRVVGDGDGEVTLRLEEQADAFLIGKGSPADVFLVSVLLRSQVFLILLRNGSLVEADIGGALAVRVALEGATTEPRELL